MHSIRGGRRVGWAGFSTRSPQCPLSAAGSSSFIGGSADSDSETSARGACAALCYELGRGVRADAERAFRLQHLAALQGHIAALNNLGACYARGVGTERNIRKAIICFEAASEAGNAEASANLRQLRAARAACSM